MTPMQALEKLLRDEGRRANRLQRAKEYEALKSSQGYIAGIEAALRILKGHVSVSTKDCEAIVRFFRGEIKMLRDSYNTPGKEDWEEFLKENDPKDWKVMKAARKAVERISGLLEKVGPAP